MALRIAIMGSGGVGGYFGARLAQGGNDVVFIARGAHLAAMREEGLRVESARGRVHLRPVQATDDPSSVGPVDAVLFAVKLWSTEEAARAVRPLVRPGTAVVSVQNGVEAREMLAPILGPEPLVGGVAYIGTAIERPGVIRHTGTMARLVIGEFDGRRTPRVEALYEACRRSEIDVELSDDIERAIWQKFVFLVGLSGLTALTRRPIGPVREDPDTRALLLEVMREAVAVGRARGVRLDPGYAEERLAFVDGLPAEMTSSMHHDLERGNRLEVAWLSGAVARFGRALGVDTPANRVIYAALKLHAAGRDAAGRA
ncbi:MAG TPA: 2-dehydropantoate 2-reductase [Thermodesulfobacteriota bacterium]|nr:2-dehydropantoate 2-reductase [Thermodesulfobacteriota bacterium]